MSNNLVKKLLKIIKKTFKEKTIIKQNKIKRIKPNETDKILYSAYQ